MPRIQSFVSILAVALPLAASAPARAQQLQQATPYAPPPPTPSAPQLGNVQAQPPANMSSDPSQRAASTSPIQSTGPSRPTPMTNSAGMPVGTTAMPLQTVRDARGQVVPGAVQVAPNRVYVPATGGYIQTTPPPPPRPVR